MTDETITGRIIKSEPDLQNVPAPTESKTADIARRIAEGKIVLEKQIGESRERISSNTALNRKASFETFAPEKKPESCATCPLYTAPGIVWGTGPLEATLAMIGEAPGMEEVDTPRYRLDFMKPFIGGSGRLLRNACNHAGFAAEGAFITNAVKCRPPGNRTPTSTEIAKCAPLLKAELARLPNLNCKLALGETALVALTGKTGITNRRGVPTEALDGTKVFPAWHPAFVARAQYQWPFFVHDLVRAKAQGEFPELRRSPYNVVRDSSVGRDGGAILESARERGATTFDFETTGLSGRTDSIVMVGLTTGRDQAYVLDWTPRTAEFFQTILDDPAIKIVGQNVLYFDLPFAEDRGLNIEKAWLKTFDTMVAFHLANASYGATKVNEQKPGGQGARGMDKDLTMIASCHTDIEYWKARSSYDKDLRGVCGTDCIATDRSALDEGTGLAAELEALGMTDLYWKHVLPVHPIIHKMSRLGVKVNTELAACWSTRLEAMADHLEEVLKQALGEPALNLASPKQLMDLLYGKFKLPIQYVTDRGKKEQGPRPTVNADAIAALGEMFPEHAGLGAIIDIRQLRMLKGTFVDPAMFNGRIHPKFGVSKASTGRFNCWDPNAQNIPEIIREMFVPDDPDHVLLAGDWSQIEWRLSMVLSGDPVGLELLSSGVDNHKAVAAEALGKPITEISDDERYAAKSIVYGLGYGRGAESLSAGRRLGAGRNVPQITMDVHFVKKFISNFLTRFRAFAAWRERNVEFANRYHYLVNAFGRRRWWYTLGNATEQYNFPQQSNAADMMYDALIHLDARLPKGATLRLTVHDEAVVHAHKSVAKEALRVMKEVMEMPWPQIVAASAYPETVKRFYPDGWFCPADIGIGTNWKMCKSKAPEDIAARKALAKELAL